MGLEVGLPVQAVPADPAALTPRECGFGDVAGAILSLSNCFE